MDLQTGALIALAITAFAGVSITRLACRSKRDEERDE